ncbi:MAG: hypothetical protein AB7G39_12490 [Alphaproteobacteria bacterium]
MRSNGTRATQRPAGGPSRAQIAWLRRGLDQPGGKLPLFDRNGQRVSERMVRACVEHGWVQPWFDNPIKPDWLVCKLTAAGRRLAEGGGQAQAAAPTISGTRLSTSTGVSK